MEDFEPSTGIGRRIRAVRKDRGIKSTAELASLIPGGIISGAVLRNIEAGAKSELSVSQLLNIARALSVSPIFLLTSIREPESRMDLPNLSDDFNSMTALEFYEWLSGGSDSIYEWSTADDLSERNQLRAMKEVELLSKQRERLALLSQFTTEVESGADESILNQELEALTARRADMIRQIDRLSTYLKSAGWNTDRWRGTLSASDQQGG